MVWMARSYDEAATALYQAPLAAFVAERKRLASELKAAGDQAGAVRLGKLARPSISAWAVNQLWWTTPGQFDVLFAAAERLRAGDLSATEAHREALATLRVRAMTLLTEASHVASETTLRRIATTLAALAAAGSFAPDAPGRLAEDRDPPGFESVRALEGAPARPLAPPRPREIDAARRARADREAQRQREEHAARERLERSLRSLGSEIERRAREVERMRTELAEAEAELEKSRSNAREIEGRLARRE